jgi:hypothetical protein
LDKSIFHYNVPEKHTPDISHRQLNRSTKSVEAMRKVLDEIKDTMRDDDTEMERGGEDDDDNIIED